MKLLFDENLSRKLPLRFTELFPSSAHVSEVGLLQVSDSAIWAYAKENGFVIVSADADSFDFAVNLGPPPKVIWLRRWTHPTRDAEALLRNQAVRVAAFEADPEIGLLVLEK